MIGTCGVCRCHCHSNSYIGDKNGTHYNLILFFTVLFLAQTKNRIKMCVCMCVCMSVWGGSKTKNSKNVEKVVFRAGKRTDNRVSNYIPWSGICKVAWVILFEVLISAVQCKRSRSLRDDYFHRMHPWLFFAVTRRSHHGTHIRCLHTPYELILEFVGGRMPGGAPGTAGDRIWQRMRSWRALCHSWYLAWRQYQREILG